MRTKKVAITGGSAGIGRAAVLKFAREGWNIVFSYNKNRATALKIKKECEKFGVDVSFEKLGLLDNSSIRKFARKVGKVDVLVNNAGVVYWGGFAGMGDRDIENLLRTNLEGLIKLTRHFVSKVGYGIVNVASRAGKIAHRDAVVYCASKFGVRGFTQALADEFPKLKIYSVNPGTVKTKMTGFRGMDPLRVADLIFAAASGKVRVRSGGDLDVFV